jgi:hypothetical protein
MQARGLMLALLFLAVSPQTQPQLPIHVESLIYPRAAYDARINGDIVVLAQIDSEGRPQIPVRPLGPPLLVQAAEENIKNWRFQIGLESQLKVTYRFRIEGEPKYDYPSTVCKFDLPNTVTVVTPPPKP